MSILNEIIDNFYKHIFPITKNIISYIQKYKSEDILNYYKNIGEKIYFYLL